MADAATAPDILLSELDQVRMYGEKEGTPKTLVRVPGSLLLSLLTAAAQGFKRYATVAARDADTGQPTGMLGYVYLNAGNVSDPANGWYQWSGTAWVAASWISNDLIASVQPQVDAAAAWAEGTLPGGAGTKSAKEHATVAGASAASAASVAAGLSTIFTSDPLDPRRRVTFTDSQGNIFYYIEEGDPLPSQLNTATRAAQLGVQREPLDVPSVEGSDEVGNRIWRVTADDWQHPRLTAIDAKAGRGVGASRIARLKLARPANTAHRLRTLFAHFIKYGQSNSINTADTMGLPAYPPPLFMFNGGVHTRRGFSPTDTLAITGSRRTGLTAMRETETETGMGAALQMVLQLLADEDGIDLTASQMRWFGSSAGVGGVNIEALRSTYMFRVNEDITAARALAVAAGESYSVAALLYNGNESNQLNTAPVGGSQVATTLANFLAQLRQVQLDVQAAAQSISGQTWPVPMFLVQTNTHLSTGSPSYFNVNAWVGRAQVEAGLNRDNVNPNIIFCGPSYQFRLAQETTAEVHFSMVGGAVRDALLGLAMKRLFFDGIKLLPLIPAVTRNGNSLRLDFDLEPGRQLEWDSTAVPLQTNYGFRVFNAAGAQQTINAVRMTGPTSVEIALAATPAAGWEVDYAIASSTGGSRGLGNLRDNQGDDIVFDPLRFNYPLHNWIPAFREIVA